MKLDEIRSNYLKGTLDADHLQKNPFEQFAFWMEDAFKARVKEPTAMTVATADTFGRPSARILLLKGYDEKGFIFYTNFDSRKGSQLEVNPYASLLFFWPELERQIRIEGKVTKQERELSRDYFASRPYESKLSAYVSPQSQKIPNRSYLEKELEEVRKNHQNEDVPMPEAWGGYRLEPHYFEFWQGRANRLHDRFRYTLVDGRWRTMRLAP
ncbi:MAG: pyridoxamine 5'-phosphate oxidase [Bacteroidales bacterium]|nr:pyridoxamine 5'-phosphate oxidase [Bacteroidales bacterium]